MSSAAEKIAEICVGMNRALRGPLLTLNEAIQECKTAKQTAFNEFKTCREPPSDLVIRVKNAVNNNQEGELRTILGEQDENIDIKLRCSELQTCLDAVVLHRKLEKVKKSVAEYLA